MDCLVRSFITVPLGRERRLKRKSTNCLSASAKRTLRDLVSMRSFRLTVALEGAAMAVEDRGRRCLGVV